MQISLENTACWCRHGTPKFLRKYASVCIEPVHLQLLDLLGRVRTTMVLCIGVLCVTACAIP